MIYLTGDTHGRIGTSRFYRKNWRVQDTLTKKDYVIILGDFGLIWHNDSEYRFLADFYSSKRFTILWIDGNHENFRFLDTFPEEDWNGGKVHRIEDNILHLERGYVFNIEGQSFFTFGGAKSVDVMHRLYGVSWWPEEEANKEEQDRALDNLEKVNNTVDFVLTHAAPKSILKPMFPDQNFNGKSGTEKFLDEIKSRVSCKRWYFGHYHEERTWENFSIIFDGIHELDKDVPYRRIDL